MKAGNTRRLRLSAALLAVCISAGLSACAIKQQPLDIMLDNMPITDNTSACQRAIINFAKHEYRAEKEDFTARGGTDAYLLSLILLMISADIMVYNKISFYKWLYLTLNTRRLISSIRRIQLCPES